MHILSSLIELGSWARPRPNRTHASQDHREQLNGGSGELLAHRLCLALQAMLRQESVGAARPQVPLLLAIE